MVDPILIALIYGSTRPGRFCDKVVHWAAAEIRRRAIFALDIIDPAQLVLPSPHKCQDRDELVQLTQRIERADAFIIVTPEYNHGYPAPLKFLIDSVYSPWQAKPVAFVSYGGIAGGLRAVEQLRLVFAELHAVTIRDSVSFANAWEQFDANGQLLQPERARRSMTALLEQLQWWARALRTARAAAPYGEAMA
jgi:NAD(P)H-dependent FMN reductase